MFGMKRVLGEGEELLVCCVGFILLCSLFFVCVCFAEEIATCSI